MVNPKTEEDWANIYNEMTIDGLGVGMLTSCFDRDLMLRVFPDPILTKKSLRVEPEEFGTFELAHLLEGLHFLMDHSYGAGLAAVQAGVLKRIITMKIPAGLGDETEQRVFTFINPEILSAEGTFLFTEGCLSIPGYFDHCVRANKITLKFRTIHGDEKIEEFEGFSAFCIQHEVDHLDGKMFVDQLSPLKKQRIKNTIKKTIRNLNKDKYLSHSYRHIKV